jgi:hypothetical protein
MALSFFIHSFAFALQEQAKGLAWRVQGDHAAGVGAGFGITKSGW